MKTLPSYGVTSKVKCFERDYPELKKIHDSCVGDCPSGVTFNMARFKREAQQMFPDHEFEYSGPTSKLPWGNVRDSVSFTPRVKVR